MFLSYIACNEWSLTFGKVVIYCMKWMILCFWGEKWVLKSRSLQKYQWNCAHFTIIQENVCLKEHYFNISKEIKASDISSCETNHACTFWVFRFFPESMIQELRYLKLYTFLICWLYMDFITFSMKIEPEKHSVLPSLRQRPTNAAACGRSVKRWWVFSKESASNLTAKLLEGEI